MAIKYSNEFKESIVSLSQTGRSANSLAKEYNVSVSTVTKWIKQADPNNTKVLSSNERALIKENKRLKEELDSLTFALFRCYFRDYCKENGLKANAKLYTSFFFFFMAYLIVKRIEGMVI